MSNRSSKNFKKKYNLKENLNFENNMSKFQEFLNSYIINKNILIFIDSRNNLWELVKRTDLNMNILNNNCENLVSIISRTKIHESVELNRESPKSKLINIEIKDHYDNISSLNGSELDISKVTDFNLSHLIVDMNEN